MMKPGNLRLTFLHHPRGIKSVHAAEIGIAELEEMRQRPERAGVVEPFGAAADLIRRDGIRRRSLRALEFGDLRGALGGSSEQVQ